MNARRTQPGFTLLEMLVALGMMAILAGALYGSLSVGFRARETAERTLEPVRVTALAMEMLRQDLASALPPTGILAGAFVAEDNVSDSGADSDTVTFFTAREQLGDTGATGSGIRKVQLIIDADDDGRPVLYRRVTANLLAPTTPDPVDQALCQNVRAMNLRYFDGADWLDSWDSTVRDNTLPLAVRVRLAIAASDDPEAKVFELTRSFLLPCGATPDSGEGVTVGEAPRP